MGLFLYRVLLVGVVRGPVGSLAFPYVLGCFDT